MGSMLLETIHGGQSGCTKLTSCRLINQLEDPVGVSGLVLPKKLVHHREEQLVLPLEAATWRKGVAHTFLREK